MCPSKEAVDLLQGTNGVVARAAPNQVIARNGVPPTQPSLPGPENGVAAHVVGAEVLAAFPVFLGREVKGVAFQPGGVAGHSVKDGTPLLDRPGGGIEGK